MTEKPDAPAVADDRAEAMPHRDQSAPGQPRTRGLSPEHRADLHGSGLSDDTIQRSGCFSIGADERHLLKPFAKNVEPPGLVLPILPPKRSEAVGFTYKPDCPRTFEKGGKLRICKYEMARGAQNRLHVPRAAQWLFDLPDGREGPRRIVLTEGWKKAEKAAQEGIGAVALAGVDNWRQRVGDLSLPIEDLSAIDWGRYAVEICFDSDAATNPHVRRAERALARWFTGRGAAKVSIVRLPAGEDGAKVGLDDFLTKHSTVEFDALLRISPDIEPPLEESVEALSAETEKVERNAILARIWLEEADPAERERLLKLAARRSGISVRAIRTTAQAEAAKVETKRSEATASQPPPSAEQAEAMREKLRHERDAAVDSILARAKTTVKLRAQTWTGRELVYICDLGDAGSLVISSAGQVLPVTALPPECVVQSPPDRSPTTPEGIDAYRKGKAISPYDLYVEIRDFIRGHLIFKHKAGPAVLSLWVMATYLYSMFNYFAYIWLSSLGPSHGKSLLCKLLSMLSFNATAPQIDPTPATVFRSIEANCCTLILDEFEHLDPEKQAELMGLLNAGYERGAEVARAVRNGEKFELEYFHVYSAKVVAGINQISRVLQTRVFAFDMPKRKPNEPIEAFKPDRLSGWSARLRDDLVVFALRNAGVIAQFYDARDTLMSAQDDRSGWPPMDDRLADILAPLAAVAAVIDKDAGRLEATPQLEAFAKVQAGLRQGDGAGDYALAAHALFNWAEERWDEDGTVLVQTKQAIEVFGAAEIDWAVQSAAAKSLLRKLGGVNQSYWWEGKTRRGYVFSKSELQDLVDRHPLPQADPDPAEKKA